MCVWGESSVCEVTALEIKHNTHSLRLPVLLQHHCRTFLEGKKRTLLICQIISAFVHQSCVNVIIKTME